MLKEVFDFATKAMAGHEAGLERRQEVRQLKEQMALINSELNGLEPSSPRALEMNEEKEALHREMDLWYAHALSQVSTFVSYFPLAFLLQIHIQGWVFKQDNYGHFFVQWHVTADLMGLKTAIGVEGEGSMSHPCPWCMATPSEYKAIGNDDIQRTWAARDLSGCVWPIPMERMHACSMHCNHRVVERILYQVMLVC